MRSVRICKGQPSGLPQRRFPYFQLVFVCIDRQHTRGVMVSMSGVKACLFTIKYIPKSQTAEHSTDDVLPFVSHCREQPPREHSHNDAGKDVQSSMCIPKRRLRKTISLDYSQKNALQDQVVFHGLEDTCLIMGMYPVAVEVCAALEDRSNGTSHAVPEYEGDHGATHPYELSHLRRSNG